MLDSIPWIGVICATFATMLVGAGWYGGWAQSWMKAAGITEEQVNAGASPVLYIIAVIAHFVMAVVLSGVITHISPQGGIADGMFNGLLVWTGFSAVPLVVTHRFQMRPWSLTLLDAGHYLVVLLVQGAVLGWFMAA
ncbi:DUF1761 domain-containing protein [Ahrensia sp. R2A130]|uniref:DUF1761 domain-containing protein n=1 Tax=Ahrensia sp. R2A130 TaxID=744979 RepID=UPI0001E0A47F|nr:DUF1761 domain-containing protein [Ahrensia sp. R2A130]EFL89673.1 putative integral membrane protein [Ahrensia sp. R2A130]